MALGGKLGSSLACHDGSPGDDHAVDAGVARRRNDFVAIAIKAVMRQIDADIDQIHFALMNARPACPGAVLYECDFCLKATDARAARISKCC